MTDSGQNSDLLYGASEIAARLKITRRQVYHLIETQGLPSFSMGRKVCARPSALSAWLAEREAAARKPVGAA